MSGEFNAEQFKALGDQFATAAAGMNEMKADLASAKLDAAEMARLLSVEIDQLKGMLKTSYGKSGADDYLVELAKFVCGAFNHAKTGQWRDDCKLMGNAHQDFVGKAAATMTTVNSTQGTSYFLPTTIAPEVKRIMEVHGSLYPLVEKVTVPAGGNYRVNADSVLPTAAWVLASAQGAIMTEEATPMSFATDLLVPALLYIRIRLSNELFVNPDANAGAIFALRLISRLLRHLETGLIAGTAASTAPSDGLLVLSGTNDQTNLAATIASMGTFMSETLVDHEGATPGEFVMATTPAKKALLQTSAIGSSELVGALAWGNPVTGAPDRLFGYPFFAHPAFLISTTHWQACFNPKLCTLAESGQIGIDFNTQGSGWEYNLVQMRATSHYDWTWNIADAISKADYT